MGFSRQEYWSGPPCHALLQGIFPTQGSYPYLLGLLYWQAGFFTTSATWEAQYLPSDAYSLQFYKDGSCARWAVLSE